MYQSLTSANYKILVPSSFNGYDVIKLIDSGSTCIVVEVEDQITKEKYAAKILSKNNIATNNSFKSIINEANILKTLDHPNIIKIKESFEIENSDSEEFIVIIMEYCENGDLLSYLVNHGIENESTKKEIIKGILSGIQYIHDREISHGDIKPDNVLLDSNLTPKLCDFGFSQTKHFAGDECKTGTYMYSAPELFTPGIKFDTLKSDIFAIGITLYTITELEFPFIDGDFYCYVQQILNGKFSYKENIDKQLLSLVVRCTKMDPTERPTVNDILNDEYLSDINDTKIDNEIIKSNEIII